MLQSKGGESEAEEVLISWTGRGGTCAFAVAYLWWESPHVDAADAHRGDILIPIRLAALLSKHVLSQQKHPAVGIAARRALLAYL